MYQASFASARPADELVTVTRTRVRDGQQAADTDSVRTGVRIGVSVAVCVAFGSAVASAQTGANRASHTDQLRVESAVRQVFGKPTRSAGTVVLYPICVSAADSRFALVVVNPVQRSGAVAQPGYYYLQRTGTRFRLLDPLLSAATSLRRPRTVPAAVYRDFGIGGPKRLCAFQGAAAVKRVLQEHTAPAFPW